MKDIPLFTSEFGVASLTLSQIPYKKCAYIRLQSTKDPKQLLSECIGFCRACGAERIFATGDSILEAYPLDTTILAMTCLSENLSQTDAALFPVTQETLEYWRTLYNEKMQTVPHAAHMSRQEANRLIAEGDGYFIHRNGTLLGIGKASHGKIDTLAAALSGAGRDVVLALASLTVEDTIRLEVADKNQKALQLYERLGFVPVGEAARWYQVD